MYPLWRIIMKPLNSSGTKGACTLHLWCSYRILQAFGINADVYWIYLTVS